MLPEPMEELIKMKRNTPIVPVPNVNPIPNPMVNPLPVPNVNPIPIPNINPVPTTYVNNPSVPQNPVNMPNDNLPAQVEAEIIRPTIEPNIAQDNYGNDLRPRTQNNNTTVAWRPNAESLRSSFQKPKTVGDNMPPQKNKLLKRLENYNNPGMLENDGKEQRSRLRKRADKG